MSFFYDREVLWHPKYFLSLHHLSFLLPWTLRRKVDTMLEKENSITFISPCKLNGAHHSKHIALFNLNTLCHCFLFCALRPVPSSELPFVTDRCWYLEKEKMERPWGSSYSSGNVSVLPGFSIPRVLYPRGLAFPCPVFSSNGSLQTTETFIGGF